MAEGGEPECAGEPALATKAGCSPEGCTAPTVPTCANTPQVPPIAFILWGIHAQQKAAMLDHRRHLVHEGEHPSPMAAHRGVVGHPFSCANDFLAAQVWRCDRLIA